jgi:hypothetical protein
MYRILLLAAAVAGLAGAASAQPRGADPFPYFIAPDGQPFRAAAGRPAPVQQWFDQVDADHDGVVTRDEFMANTLNFFAFLDTDQDGAIAGAENTRYETRVAPEITIGGPPAFAQAPTVGADGRPVRTRMADRPLDGAARFSFFNEPQPVRVADTNLDWRVSQAEWRVAAERRFRTLDTDNDGRLTLATLPAAPDPRRDRRR